MGNWSAYAEAEVAAAASLTGLVFVALSINLQRILNSKLLVGLGFEALLLLSFPVATGLLVLSPLHRDVNGPMELGVASAFTAALLWLLVRGFVRLRAGGHKTYAWSRALMVLAAVTAELTGAALLCSGEHVGVAWLCLGALPCLAGGLGHGWVLLVEIVR